MRVAAGVTLALHGYQKFFLGVLGAGALLTAFWKAPRKTSQLHPERNAVRKRGPAGMAGTPVQ